MPLGVSPLATNPPAVTQALAGTTTTTGRRATKLGQMGFGKVPLRIEVFGDLVRHAFDFGFTEQTATVDLEVNPKSGNLLIFVFGSDSSSIALTTAPVGFTLLTSSEDGNGTHFWWYKVSDGTEQIRSATMDLNSQLQGRYAEYVWDGSTPVVQTNENVVNISTNTNSQPSGAITPVFGVNILLAAHFSEEALNNVTYQDVDGAWIEDTVFETSNTGQGKLSRLVSVSGSQEATHSDTSIGRPMYGAIAEFGVASASVFPDFRNRITFKHMIGR